MSTSLSLPRSTTWHYPTLDTQRCSFCNIGTARYSIGIGTCYKTISYVACGDIRCVCRLALLQCAYRVHDHDWTVNAAWTLQCLHGDINAVCDTLQRIETTVVREAMRRIGADYREIAVIVAHCRDMEENKGDVAGDTLKIDVVTKWLYVCFLCSFVVYLKHTGGIQIE